jgi:glycosyltransferase involved in cell wall biosynthesis
MKSKPDIICISTQDWNDLWTRKQRFMKRFAEMGCRVLYIETQVHWITYLRELRRRWGRIFAFLSGSRKIRDNLWVTTPPLVLPFFQMNSFICKLNSRLLSWYINQQSSKLGFDDPVIYSYVPSSSYLMRRLKSTRKLYECVDEFAVDKGLVRKKTIARLERETMSQCNAVVVTAQFLYDRKSRFARNMFLIPNAVDTNHYKKTNAGVVTPAEIFDKLPKPVIGFVGALAYWIDLDLIAFIAETFPRYSFLFVGPVSVSVDRLRKYDNIHFLGRKPYEELPRYLAGIDVCINPYVLDDIASGCSPLKLYEYIAAGKPVVSVRMPEAEKFEGLVEIADSYEQFATKIRMLVSKDEKWKRNLADRSWKESQNHTWDKRFEQTVKVLEECFDEDRN